MILRSKVKVTAMCPIDMRKMFELPTLGRDVGLDQPLNL